MSDTYSIRFSFDDREPVTAEAAGGVSLLGVARRYGVAIDAPCAGNGTCGKCLVKLVSGEVETGRNRHISDAE
ncbi:MAG: 2Fe-2S iron-sulfur cluster binding domain-containing protein, partial [Clostridiales Family XIII bacterium]|nr:2Fe-2S iron-sulfur cluster binding domain-containing protein [Clostridiales Family XIII bacterium]